MKGSQSVMRTGYILIIMFAFLGTVLGEEDQSTWWQNSVIGGINMTQTGFDNWAAGGESAFAWQLNLKYSFVKDTDKMNWSNTGKFSYGATKTGEADMRKSIDEIKAESVWTYKLGSSINPFLAVTGETQFAPGYDYGVNPINEISAFLDPGYFRESLGVGMIISEGVNTRLGLSLKQTVTSSHPIPYSDDLTTTEVETLRSEYGAESVTNLSLDLSETSLLTSKLELFSAFRSIDEIDVNLDNTLMVKISEYLNVNINIKLVYDKDISVKRQIKQSMALGFNYTFI